MVRTRDPPSSATSAPIFRSGISARHDPFGLQIALAIVGMMSHLHKRSDRILISMHCD